MAPLHDALRRELEKTVIKARDVAEAGARAALARLTIGDREPGAHLSADDRILRNRLRARARQLGDRRNDRTGEQETDRLTQEVAYEAWHRMLFARFLAENRLLIHPEMQVPVSLEECEELAAEEGIGDGWVLASRYAARMLPEIFRPDDPVLQVPFAPEHQQELERLVSERTLPRETFLADDSLGWVYQFWQARRKDEVNASGEKITGETLPAVTQLFTEPYMVSFLLENTIGAWWAGRNPGKEPPVEMAYLRRMEDGTPAAGTFEGWPRTWREFTLLDPCCGSGHILVAALKLIVPLRMHDEGLSAPGAVDAVLRENLHGLELDTRCTQIAAFALALTAWTYPEAGGYRLLPRFHVACSGLEISGRKEEWRALAQGEPRLETALGRLHQLFQQAPELGSLIEPEVFGVGDLFAAGYGEVEDLLMQALASEAVQHDAVLQATAVTAHGVWKAVELLRRKYTTVVTNVPYLHRTRQSQLLRDFLTDRFREQREDLAAAFVQRNRRFLSVGGTQAVVTPQSWLFLTRYTRFRIDVLESMAWHTVARLGTGAFGTIGGAVVNVALVIVSAVAPEELTSFVLLDATSAQSAREKAENLAASQLTIVRQRQVLSAPDARLLAHESDLPLLGDYAISIQGMGTSDLAWFKKKFWEVPEIGPEWARLHSAPDETVDYGGREHLLFWENGVGAYYDHAMRLKSVGRLGGWKSGGEAWGRRGVSVRQMGKLAATLYTGEFFDNNTAAIIPKDERLIPAIWCFCKSEEFTQAVRRVDSKVGVTNATLVKVPFDLEYWSSVATDEYPDGLPAPHSTDPTQWLFQGSITNTDSALHVAVARLVGYRWPEQPLDPRIDRLADTDGIVCLPAVRGERPAADRLSDVLAAAHQDEWTAPLRERLLSDAGSGSGSMAEWLRDQFFEQHCRVFHQVPFVWHVWDGRKDGFSALVNYHRLTNRVLETLTYTYLGEWITRQEEARGRGDAGAEGRVIAARDLQDKLKAILKGEPPYDIFVRWKPLYQQPVGWDPDLNDGVRVNIWPFVRAGVLRKPPNIKWGKDRGKNPPDSPWGDERWNRYEEIPRDERPEYLRDVDQLTTEIKRRAREVHARGLSLSRLHEVGA